MSINDPITAAIFVKPAQGLQVLDPVNGDRLHPDGEEKPANQFWHRRIATGDVELAKKPRPTPAKPSATKQES